jgi:hypothetical protein
MEVKTKASGTDKIKSQNNALQMAKLQLIDPVTFYEDMGLSDPSGRAVKLLSFLKDPATYLTAFIAESPEVTQDLLQKISAVVGVQPPTPESVPVTPGQNPNNMPPPNPQQPIPGDTSQMAVLPPSGAPPGSANNIVPGTVPNV